MATARPSQNLQAHRGGLVAAYREARLAAARAKEAAYRALRNPNWAIFFMFLALFALGMLAVDALVAQFVAR